MSALSGIQVMSAVRKELSEVLRYSGYRYLDCLFNL